MREHPNAIVVRRIYEASALGDQKALAALVPDVATEAAVAHCVHPCLGALTPLALVAAGDLVVVIDSDGVVGEGVALFRVCDGLIVDVGRIPLTGPDAFPLLAAGKPLPSTSSTP